MNDLVEVKVMIPTERIGAFYELLGRFLNDKEPNGKTSSPWDAKLQFQSGDWNWKRTQVWTAQGTREERVQAARLFMRQLAPGARRFLDYLLDKPDHEASAEEIVRALNLESPRTLAGQLSSFGFVAKRVNRLQPFQMRYGPSGESIYMIEPDIAEVFREARQRENER